jgi:hypothetical protein
MLNALKVTTPSDVSDEKFMTGALVVPLIRISSLAVA